MSATGLLSPAWWWPLVKRMCLSLGGPRRATRRLNMPREQRPRPL